MLNTDKSEDSYNIMIKKLRLHELERDITNLRAIIANIIIPKLNTVDLKIVIIHNFNIPSKIIIFNIFRYVCRLAQN